MSPAGKLFRARFVGADCARSGCLAEFDPKGEGPLRSLFPFAAASFPLSLPPTPKPAMQLQLGLSVVHIEQWSISHPVAILAQVVCT